MRMVALLVTVIGLLTGPACDNAATGDTDVEWPGASGDDGASTDCEVTVSYIGAAVTIAGTPVGLSDADRESEAVGTFTYDACVADGNEDPDSGDYDHTGDGAFELTVAGATITGSGSPIIEILDGDTVDTFRYIDGPQFGDEIDRVMLLNGERTEDLELWISISDSTGASFSDDSLPTAFPMVDISCCTHTFSLSDEAGTLLLQLDSMAQQ